MDKIHKNYRRIVGINGSLIALGREMGMEYPKEIIELGEPLLQVEGLGQQGVFGGVDFTPHKGRSLVSPGWLVPAVQSL